MSIQRVDDSATALNFIDISNPLQHVGKTVKVCQAKAAPNMLEALKDIMSDQVIKPDGTRFWCRVIPSNKQLLKAKAAIDQAEGRS